MSLSSFVDLPVIKARFKQEFTKPRLVTKGIKMIAPPMTAHYSVIGTAFDYLFRFILQKHNSKAVCSPWIAEKSIEILNKQISGYDIDAKKPMDYRAEISRASKILSQARKLHEDYLVDGKITNKLLKASLELAYLDFVYRTSWFIEETFLAIAKIDKRDIEDLRRLIDAIDMTRFKARTCCILNPSFGDASKLVGGADADIILDDMLIDVKTTKRLLFEPAHFNQLIGYYVLSLIGKIKGYPSRKRIKKVGIYYARYGYLYLLDVKEIIDPDALPEFIEWFKKMASVPRISLRGIEP